MPWEMKTSISSGRNPFIYFSPANKQVLNPLNPISSIPVFD